MSNPIGRSAPRSGQQIAERHPTHEEIELRAYQIYVERGGAQGNDLQDWLQAEFELIEEYGKTGQTVKATVAKIHAMAD
jgi:DUF2934 family protein